MNIYLSLLYGLFIFLTQASSALADAQVTDQFRMGFYAPSLSDINRTDMQISLEYWAQEIASKQKLVKSAPVTIFSDIELMAQAIEHGELDMIVAPPLEMAIFFKRETLDDGFMSIQNENHQNSIIILVKKSNKINSAKDLNKKRLLIDKNDILSKVVLDNFLLKNLKQTAKQVFSNVIKAENGNRMVLDLFFDKADVAVVYSNAFQTMTELNPQIGEQLMALYSYPIKSRNLSFFRKGYPYNAEMREIATNLKTPRMQQIFEVFRTDFIEPCSVNELSSYDVLYREYKKLSGETRLNMEF